MENYFEKRMIYDPGYPIYIDEEMKEKALEFAKEIILTDNQYSRLLPYEIRNSGDISMQHKIEIQRTYMGKLGEIVFLKFLQQNNKHVNTYGMFDVFEGQQNVDSFDFITSNGKSVDIKTGFRSIHKRLLVNLEQFNNIPKDFYVAVKIYATDVNFHQKLVDWNSISSAKIIGYADYVYMDKYADTHDFGEGLAKWLPYNRLMRIDKLIDMF